MNNQENTRTACERLTELIIPNPSINLQSDEVCFFQGLAYGVNDKNVITGYSGNGAGISVRVAKGLSIHTGGSAKKAIRSNVTERSSGKFYITNQRIILLSPKYGFELSIPKITSTQIDNDRIVFYSNGKSYSVEVNDFAKAVWILRLMDSGFLEQSGQVPPPIEDYNNNQTLDEIYKEQQRISNDTTRKHKKKWSELNKKEKIKRIAIIAISVVAVIVLAIIGGTMEDNDSTNVDNNQKPQSTLIFKDYPEISNVIASYNSLANKSYTASDFKDNSDYSLDWVTITINGLYTEFYHNNAGTWIEISKASSSSALEEDDYKNQFILCVRALKSSVTYSQANNIWIEITTNEYGVYSGYEAYGLICSTYDTIDSPYNIKIELKK